MQSPSATRSWVRSAIWAAMATPKIGATTILCPAHPPGNLGRTVEQPWDLPGMNQGGPAPRPVSPIYSAFTGRDCPQPKISQVLDPVPDFEFPPDSTGPTTTTIYKFDQILFVESRALSPGS